MTAYTPVQRIASTAPVGPITVPIGGGQPTNPQAPQQPVPPVQPTPGGDNGGYTDKFRGSLVNILA